MNPAIEALIVQLIVMCKQCRDAAALVSQIRESIERLEKALGSFEQWDTFVQELTDAAK